MFDRLQVLKERFTEIEDMLAIPEIATDHERVQVLARERSTLLEIVTILFFIVSQNTIDKPTM